MRRLAAAPARHALRGAAYWLGSGIVGRPRPRLPRRHGRGPYKTAARYFADLAFYPTVSTAWLAGRAYRPVWRRGGAAVAAAPAQWEAVRHLPVLSGDACEAIAEQVHALRSLWLPRQPGFYTLGYAAYMDCRDPIRRLRYFDDAPRLNAALMRHFAPLYRDLARVLEAVLGAPCRLAERQAMPGFHVWLGPGIPHIGFDTGSVHFDLQYLDNGLADDGWPEPADVVSFTLPVRLPRAGGGLNVWDVRHPEPAGPEVWPFARVSRVRYRLGSLVLHTGHELHQIAPIERVMPGDERICLQGHGLRRDGSWLLYW